MRIARDTRRAANRMARRARSEVRRHPGAVVMGAGSVAAVVGAVLSRMHRDGLPELPDAAQLAGDAAASVHNAAKASVITAVREHLHPQRDVVLDAVRLTIYEAAASGVDLTAAALGAVEGAAEIASPLGESQLDLARAAAEAARTAAASTGPVAEQRVADALAALLEA